MNKNNSRRDFRAAVFSKLGITLTSLMLIALIVGCPGGKSKSSGPNILLITIDNVRADLLGPKAPKPMEMPVLDKLWVSGAVFTNAMVASPLTTASYATLFTGEYPPTHGVRDSRTDKLPESAVTLAEVLKEAGWRTGAVVSNLDTVSRWGLGQGFDYYNDTLLPPPDDEGLPQRTWSRPVAGSEVSDVASGWIEDVSSGDKPWFLWVEYSDANPPRNPPSPFTELFPDDNYSATLSYIDANIGLLTGKLKDLGLDDKTLIVITSSYGADLGQKEEFSKAIFAYRDSLQVPVLFVMGGLAPAQKEIDTAVSQVDIMPTILDLVDVKPPRGVAGVSVADAVTGDGKIDSRPIYSENMTLEHWHDLEPVHSIIDGKYHYLNYGSPELYDLEADPEEKNNIAKSDSEALGRMEKTLAEMLEDMKKERLTELNTRDQNVADVNDKLRAFGFLTTPERDSSGKKLVEKSKISAYVEDVQDAKMRRGRIEFSMAEDILTNLLKQFPDSPNLRYLYGELLFQTERMDEAEKELRISLASEYLPIELASMVLLAKIKIVEDDAIEGEKLLELAIKLMPDNPGLHYLIGNLYLKQGMLVEAENTYRKTLELEPRFYRAHFGLASTYIQDGRRVPAAAEELAIVLDQNPKFIPARLMMADIAEKFFQNKIAARDHLRAVLDIIAPGSDLADQLETRIDEMDIPTSEEVIKCIRPE